MSISFEARPSFLTGKRVSDLGILRYSRGTSVHERGSTVQCFGTDSSPQGLQNARAEA
jgi:hypothetical protein